MSAEEIKKAIKDSGLSIGPGEELSTEVVESCTVCAFWSCLLAGACHAGCSADSGCISACIISACNDAGCRQNGCRTSSCV